MDKVFVLHHVHVYPGGDEDVKLLGVYRSEAMALMAVDRFKLQPGFRDLPDVVVPGSDSSEGFHITDYVLDEDEKGWAEGYVTG